MWHVTCRHRWRRCVSCWCAARCSWSRSMLRVRRFWAIIHVFLVSVRGVSNLPASRGCSFCRSSNRLLGSVLVMFLRARRWLVGACAFHIQREKRTFANEHKVSIPTYFRFTGCRNYLPHVSQYGLAYTVYRAVPGPAHHYLQGSGSELVKNSHSISSGMTSDWYLKHC